MARVASSGSQQLVVEPFDKSLCKEIEKAISTSGLNLTPNNDGNIIRINIPPLTEERRKELVKQVNMVYFSMTCSELIFYGYLKRLNQLAKKEK